MQEVFYRRTFLKAAAVGSLLEGSLTPLASGQNNPALFKTAKIDVAGNKIFYRRYGQGPGDSHGSRLSADQPDVAIPCAEARRESHRGLRRPARLRPTAGYPLPADDHFPYSKRAMAKELVEVMAKLGFPTFTLIGHDRGGRVAYRMALDHPKNVERLAVFDVIPILEAWNRSDARFAQTYWPWILLSQKQPLPESYLLGAPEAVFHNPFGQGSFGPEILEEYVSTYRDPARVHGICEEYRAAATIDVEHDRADKEASKRIECPMLHLWAEGGPLDTFYAKDGGPLGIWRQWAPRAQGQAMKGGHFFPEENPDDTAALVSQFLTA